VTGGCVFYIDGTYIDSHSFLDPVHDDGESLIQVGRLIDLLHNVLQGIKHQKISSGPYDDV
jgi:hypothetical protein